MCCEFEFSLGNIKNGILLAQDAYGNYVVQYILELQIPLAVSKLTSQFKGNYVHLATQKFSSHVVEKCLAMLDAQIRSTIIRELISATQFEQLLQDPHANYVIQTALRVSKVHCFRYEFLLSNTGPYRYWYFCYRYRHQFLGFSLPVFPVPSSFL
ncbi:putative armadillo-like helical, pumilio domain-containing protein [Helianthus annuus]|uniref:Armadillo-like helical, pumilio domain-containing protein n=1 Tax=Helianthus annuus TaxID=4232 RepID=A0A9K3J9Q9_HELAN|nr:putative armadillo-like helical, pumilio domain-containing protein [Helianthus annuus]